MSEQTDPKVGDWLLLTAHSIDAERYVKIERETNTQWVCTDEIRVVKSQGRRGMSVFGADNIGAKLVPGVATTVSFAIDTDKAAEAAEVIADFLEAAGKLVQAMALRATIASYREFVAPREIKPLAAKWSRLNDYQYRAPDDMRWRYELRAGSETLATIRAEPRGGTVDAPDGWVWRARGRAGFVFDQSFFSVREAKDAIRDARSKS